MYNLSLINLNTITYNHPAIDLGDELNGVSVQVTSDGSREKLSDTIEKYIQHQLNDTYSEIWFLIISTDPKISFTRQNLNISIKTLSDVSRDICELPDTKFDKMYAYCKKQFKDYFKEIYISPLAPKFVSSEDPKESIINFLKANELAVMDEYMTASPEDIRNDLIEMKNTLSGMNDDQRWFLYHVVYWSMQQRWQEDRCMAPASVIDQIRNQKVVSSTYESLMHLGFVYYDEWNSYTDSAVFFVRYGSKSVKEFDYFAGICIFLRQSNKRNELKHIIVDCDFSVID